MKPEDFFPTCAICNNPVETMVWYDNPFNQTRRYIAKCHGDTEVTEISILDIESMTGPNAISGGIAFSRQRLK